MLTYRRFVDITSVSERHRGFEMSRLRLFLRSGTSETAINKKKSTSHRTYWTNLTQWNTHRRFGNNRDRTCKISTYHSTSVERRLSTFSPNFESIEITSDFDREKFFVRHVSLLRAFAKKSGLKTSNRHTIVTNSSCKLQKNERAIIYSFKFDKT